MGRKDKFEDDGRTIADMSGIESAGLFGRRPRTSPAKKDGRRNSSDQNDTENMLPIPPFTWQERIRYVVMALGAALLIGVVLLGGIAFVIWLFTLYA